MALVRTVVDLGEVGTVGGVLRPWDLTLRRDGGVWDLTGYTALELRVWAYLTKTIIVINGTLALQTALSGIVRYTPGTADPIHANSGVFEARAWGTPGGAGDPEASGLFRFSIGAGPTHT